MRWAPVVAVAALALTGCASNRVEDRDLLTPGHAAKTAEPCPELGPAYVSRFGGVEAQKEDDRGKLFLVLLDDKDEPSLKGGRSMWGLSQPITYTPTDGSGKITVPAGFRTDLASIPRIAWDMLPPDGPWAKAAVIHDYLYRTKGTGIWSTDTHTTITWTDPKTTFYDRAHADWILRDAMRDRCVGEFDRNVIYQAVRLGGDAGWGH